MSDGAELIAAERLRQVTAEGWTPEHDAEHNIGGTLGMAASAYTWAAQLADGMDASDMTPADWVKWCPDYWPWAEEEWKPSNDPVRNLAKAGALIAAEIDRLGPPAAPSPVLEEGPTGLIERLAEDLRNAWNNGYEGGSTLALIDEAESFGATPEQGEGPGK